MFGNISRKNGGGNSDNSGLGSPPQPPPPPPPRPPSLTKMKWSELSGIGRVRRFSVRSEPIPFQVIRPTKVRYNSGILAKINIILPPVAVGSTLNLAPKKNDKLVAVNKMNENLKYLIGTIESRQGNLMDGFKLKIRTPDEYNHNPRFELSLNNVDFKIIVINEERPRRRVFSLRVGSKKRKALKRKGSEKKNKSKRGNSK